MPSPRYHAYTASNFRSIPQLADLPEETKREIDIVSRVLPFKTDSYVVDELIDWSNIPDDPIYTLNFPRRELLKPEHYNRMAAALDKGLPENEIKATAKAIQAELNPDVSGQSANVPMLDGHILDGAQHKYRETVLFFPQAGQTCHAYCTFCFRWAQFSGLVESRFSGKESAEVAEYIRARPGVSDLLLTGGDPLVMGAATLEKYVEPFLDDSLEQLKTIRFGTKSLAYWPYRYLSDPDSDDILRLFERIVAGGRNVCVMAHFNHPVELSTKAARDAVKRLAGAGAQIRTQSPLLSHINDKPELWSEMWQKQVDLGCIPYYMFVERDTGAKQFYAMPLERCWRIFRDAYKMTSGLCRTVRGPVMSATPGKVHVLGIAEAGGERVFALEFIQGRDADWVGKPFFARYDGDATWLDGLKPAFGAKRFFFDDELKRMLADSARLHRHG